jgi:hypothetical protein
VGRTGRPTPTRRQDGLPGGPCGGPAAWPGQRHPFQVPGMAPSFSRRPARGRPPCRAWGRAPARPWATLERAVDWGLGGATESDLRGRRSRVAERFATSLPCPSALSPGFRLMLRGGGRLRIGSSPQLPVWDPLRLGSRRPGRQDKRRRAGGLAFSSCSLGRDT